PFSLISRSTFPKTGNLRNGMIYDQSDSFMRTAADRKPTDRRSGILIRTICLAKATPEKG
ncbi:MAG: hypothetical protein AAFW66_02620, partial [Pseudomonadota bacterium]